MQSRFRKSLTWLHTWVGLTAGLAMIFLAVTGGIVVMRGHFEDQLNAHLVRASVCASPLPLDTQIARARNAHPGKGLDSIELRAEAATSTAVLFKDKTYVYVDPCTAKILGQQNAYGGFFGTLDGWHRFRFIHNGRTIAGILDLAFALILIVGGGILWWPRRPADLKGALVFNPRLKGLAGELSLHKVIGIWATALLLLLTVTGLPIAFDWARLPLAWATHSTTDAPKPPKMAMPKGAHMTSWQSLYDGVRTNMPDMTWMAISPPKPGQGALKVEVIERGAPHIEAKSYLFFAAADGHLLKAAPYATGVSAGRKAYLYILALHSGLVGGIVYQLALVIACFCVPVQAYTGANPYIRKWLRKKAAKAAATPRLSLRVVNRRVEAEDIVSFELTAADGRPLPAFSAGSHIEVEIAQGLTRQYSLCNDPRETHRYLIAVLKTPDSRGGSQGLHERVQTGDILNVSLPKNHFHLTHIEGPVVLIAGGIGITPILCMAERLDAIGAPFVLHYTARAAGRMAFAERITSSGFAQAAHLYRNDQGEHLDLDGVFAAADPSSHVYVCGPAGLIEAVRDRAAAAGWPEDHIHQEYFKAAVSDAVNLPFQVKLASSGAVLDVAADQTLVAALEQHGLRIPTSCSEGVCGACLTQVLEGEVDHRDVVLSPAEHARHDQMTPCCSRAKSPLLVLDL
ncbi:MAG TPA: PepSY domain-containing protein [Asticcacaulis sp.]|nr:PepSY domain-containing protein [Asticcacaulis sp.]